MDELYDLKEDSYEMNNLITSPDHQARIREMKQRLLDLLLASDVQPSFFGHNIPSR